VEEPLQFPKRTQTKSTLSETNLRASKIIGGSTTLVVRNLPIGCTKELLLQMWPPDGTYDYLYLPFSFNQSRSAVYVFVNCTSHAAALAFYFRWHGQFLFGTGSSSKLNISTAPVQGLEENVRHLVHCKISRVKNPKHLPSVFNGLREVPFNEYVERLRMGCKDQSFEASVESGA